MKLFIAILIGVVIAGWIGNGFKEMQEDANHKGSSIANEYIDVTNWMP